MTQASVLIGEAKTRADGFIKDSNDAMRDAVNAAGAITFTSITPGTANIPTAPAPLNLTAPRLSPVTLVAPSPMGPAPTYQDITPINPDAGKPAAFAKPPPVTVPPTAPNRNLIATPPTSPDVMIDGIAWPSAPADMTGIAPSVAPRAEPSRAEVTIPAFGALAPTDAPNAPGDLSAAMQAGYHAAAPEFITSVNGYVDAQLAKLNPQYSAQMAAVESQLAKYLAGGTGIAVEVEEAIYSRARARNDLEARKVQDAAFADTAARGFTIPGGALLSSLARARQDAANNQNKTINEIVVMKAEMEQKNLQFAVTTSANLRVSMVNATLGYMQSVIALNGQALDYAKGILNAMVETFNISAKVFNTKLDVYKSEALVYDTKLKAGMAQLERYRVEVAALQAMTQVDHAKVEIYLAGIQAQVAKNTIYRTQIDAAVSKAQLEKLKVDVYQAQVQAYGASIQAYNSEWQGYTAAWGGETAKMAGFKAEVDAYSAQNQAYATGISGASAAAQAQAMTNEARAKQFNAEVQAYSTKYEVAGKKATVELENNRQEVVAFQAEAAAKVAEANGRLEYYKAVGQISIEQAKLDTTTMIASAEHNQKGMALLAQLHTANATVHANLAGAAMSGINSLAVESFTE